MGLPPLQTRQWSDRRLEVRGWFNRVRLSTESVIDDAMLRAFFAAVDVPGVYEKHFLITIVEVTPEDLP